MSLAAAKLHPAPADEGDVRARRLDQARGNERPAHVKRDAASQRFKRSTERKEEDPNEALVNEADRAVEAREAAFESRAPGPPGESRSCRDESRYDLEGRAW